MSLSPHTVLIAVVDAVEESGGPVPVQDLAESIDVPESTLCGPLESLRECELVEASDRGYRPTITAYELLAKDIDLDDVLVVDPVEE